MIETIASSSNVTVTNTSADRTAMGQAQFMQLLVEQLKNQDPLNPLQPHEFASQLASFSSVEQLALLNEEVALQSDNAQIAAALSKTSFSAALIGREVVAQCDRISLSSGESAEILADIPAGAEKLVVRFFDENGAEVARRDVAAPEAGRSRIQLPDDLPAGEYNIAVAVVGEDGAETAATTYTAGTVDRILFTDGQIRLEIHGIDVVLEAVLEVSPAVKG